jgi:hypothetical protein
MSGDELHALADFLVEKYGGTAVGSLLVRVERHRKTGETQVGVRPLDGHPADALNRFHAPTSWIALGLVCGGWAAPMDGVRPPAHPDALRITHVILLDRNGDVASRLRFPDGRIMGEPPSEGAVLDALKASLGVSSACP